MEHTKNVKKEITKKATVSCHFCGTTTIDVPNIYGSNLLKSIKPYCPTGLILTVQWLIYNGWHVLRYDANEPHSFCCPDCYKQGKTGKEPEYIKLQYCDTWCAQVKKWMEQ